MLQPLPDHYRVLKVHPSARVETIHAAYRELARRLHPDVSGDDAAMKQLNVAWDTLRDSRRRAAYDRDRLAANPHESIVVSKAPAWPTDTAAEAQPGSEALHATIPTGHAGPPPGRPFGPIMSFGRYEGWSLGEIAQHDPGWLRWLRRVPAGRQFAANIDVVFAELEARPHTLGGRRMGGLAARVMAGAKP